MKTESDSEKLVAVAKRSPPAFVSCGHCGGDGVDPIDTGDCYLCNGSGKITKERHDAMIIEAENLSSAGVHGGN